MAGHRSEEGSSHRRWLTATALAAALTMLLATSADAFVFWANRDSESIGRAKTNGKGVDQSYIKVRTSVYGVAVDDDHVYWTDRKGGGIGRASRNGSTVKRKFVTGLSSPHGIAVDDHYMYWANSGTDSIGRAALDGSGANPSFIADAKGAVEVAVDGQYVYWTNSAGIGRASLDGTGANTSFVSTQAYGVAVDSGHIYWAFFGYSPTRGGVSRAKLNGSGIEKKFVSARRIYPHDVAVDDAHVWWVEQSGIGRSNLRGKNVRTRVHQGSPRRSRRVWNRRHGGGRRRDAPEDDDQAPSAGQDPSQVGPVPVRFLRARLEFQVQARQAPLEAMRGVV